MDPRRVCRVRQRHPKRDLTAGPTARHGVQQIDQQPVVFDGSNSFDPDGSIVAWDWDFGDGAMGAGLAANNMFSTPGDYNVTVTASMSVVKTRKVEKNMK